MGSNTSGTTQTTMTLIDGTNSIEGSIAAASLKSPSLSSRNSTRSISQSDSGTAASSSNRRISCTFSAASNGMQINQIFNYKLNHFVDYSHLPNATVEEICIDFCKSLGILPTTRLLFGLRQHQIENDIEHWIPPCHTLHPGTKYSFRMRFKVPDVETQLKSLDGNAFEYLYAQLRSDMVLDRIPDIRDPAKKNNVVGLGVVDMYIDLLERKDTMDNIKSNYKHYLPRHLVKTHKFFAKKKICEGFHEMRSKNHDLARVKWAYMHTVTSLAPNYLLERYVAGVDYIPDEDADVARQSGSGGACNGSSRTEVNGLGHAERVYVKLDLYDTPEPGMKISRITAEEKLKWVLVAKLENIYALYEEGREFVRLEVTGFPNGYRMQFQGKADLESFITYLAGYRRLTSKWMVDLCVQYVTPSLQELKNLRCHGPVGGSFSFAKIREKRDQCGSYIIRQCEKEYDTYYIDINTKTSGSQPEKFRTETFKITKDSSDQKWILHFNDNLVAFDKLTELALHIPTESEQKFRIPPSEYDKPPLLLICLPKNLQSKKTETELSEAELQRKRVQIFDPKIDLQWYKNSQRECDNGKMIQMRADWIQQNGSFKDVCVTLKVLKSDTDFPEFMKLANTWSQIYSPQFIKLYGLTLSTPYTMIMEHSKYGPLNEFLMRMKEKVTLRSLLDVVHGLVRGIVYLQEYGIIHGYIRCSNLFVTKFDQKSNLLEAKIADPGFPRPYRREELPWIPFEYYKDMNAAKYDSNAELWAFATTVWEIFARGKTINNMTEELLRQNYNRYGGILPTPSNDCPEEMYKTMMDGWSVEPDKRFSHQKIFIRLIMTKETLSSNYASVDCTQTPSDTASLQSDYSGITDGTYNGMNNGHSGSDMQSCTFSGTTTTTCDRTPLIGGHHQTQHNHINQSVMMMNNSQTTSYESYFDDTPSVLQIPNGKVIYKKKIGEGHYGTVYLGEIRYNNSNREREQVAIKTLKSFKLTQLNKDFMREIQIMQTLDHPNIVKIKEWVEDPISIIMEYLECGSFIVYLSSKKPNLTNEKLLRFALDIAKGMDYLRSQKVIHRDLAARNILVDRDLVKISDFGLAQMANADGYYFAQSEREIPIKWYSPESIKTAKFSFQSDVWSYGVTLFEMFSRGETPNLDADKEPTQEEFLNRLESGDRLRKPALCPDIVYDKLMMSCWQANPKMRPNFKDLINEIQSIKSESGECI